MCTRYSAAVTLLLTSFLLPTIALAQPLSDRVPADAIVYLGWQGTEKLPAAYDQSRTKALLDASGFPKVFNQMLPAAIQRLAREDKRAAEDINAFLSLTGPMWRHPTAVFFSGVDFKAQPQPSPRGALLCDAGNEAKALLDHINKLLAANPPDPDAPPIKTSLDGNIVVLSIGYADNAAILAGKADIKSIATTDAFKQAIAQVNKEPVAIAYIDIEGALANLEQAVDFIGTQDIIAAWPKIKAASSIEGLKRFIWTGGFVGQDFSSDIFIAAPAPRKGLLAFFDSRPMSAETLQAIPKTATWASVIQFEVAKLIPTLRDADGQVDPQMQAFFDKGLGGARAALAMDIQKELFESLGPDWAFYIDPTTSGQGPLGLTIVNKLAKAAEAEKAAGTLELFIDNAINALLSQENVRITFDVVKINGVKIHYAQTPFLSPSYAFHDGKLYLALYPQMVAEAINHATSKGPSILDNPAFVDARKRLGNDKVSGFSFVDVPATAGNGYQLLLAATQTGIGAADMFGIKTPPMVLPPLSEFRKHLSPAASFSWSDDQGWHCRGASPFPGASLLAMQGSPTALGAVLTSFGAALPAMAKAEERSKRVRSANNLRQIGIGLILYSNDHNGRYPTSLAPLILEADVPHNAFFSATNKNRPAMPAGLKPEDAAAWISENADYVYIGSTLSAKHPADSIIAYEKPEATNHQGMHLLYNDGSVRWLPVEVAMQQIDRQQREK